MTETETIKILAMLGAFYGGGKTDPKAQVKAWHTILYKYPFDMAERAVINFAENDVRDYATFPAVGKIVQAIQTEIAKDRKPIDETIMNIHYGRDYGMLSPEAKRLISKERYDHWLSMNAEVFNLNSSKLRESLSRNSRALLESREE